MDRQPDQQAAQSDGTRTCPHCRTTFMGRPGQRCPRCECLTGDVEGLPWEMAPVLSLRQLRGWPRTTVLLFGQTEKAFMRLRENRPALSGVSYLLLNVLALSVIVIVLVDAAVGISMSFWAKAATVLLLGFAAYVPLFGGAWLLASILRYPLRVLGVKDCRTEEIRSMLCYALLPALIGLAFCCLTLGLAPPGARVTYPLYVGSCLLALWTLRTVFVGIRAYYGV